MKKFLAVLLTVFMVLGCVSVVAFAEEPETPVAEPSVPSVCTRAGDINNDGVISPADARLALRYSLGLTFDDEGALANTEQAVQRADVVDADKEDVTPADARWILRMALQLEDAPAHLDKNADAKWTVGAEHVCAYCGEKLAETEEAKLCVVIDDVNGWAASNGLASFVNVASEEEDEAKEITLELNVDAIWTGFDIDSGLFDGLLTKLGGYVKEQLADAEIKYKDDTVYAGGLKNTAVKNALFDIGGGFFYKIANLNEDGVYGEYNLVIDTEPVKVTVKLTGENLPKVKTFAATIADHISADVIDGNLTITMIMPDQLMSKVENNGGLEAVNQLTIGECIGILETQPLEKVIGSNVSAVKKLCKTINGFDALVNKVVAHVTEANVTVKGENVDLLKEGATFAPDKEAEDPYKALLSAAKGMLSDEAKDIVVGDLATAEGEYTVPVNVTVDVASLGLFQNNGQISETVVFVLKTAA